MVEVSALTRSIVEAGRLPLHRSHGIPMAAYSSQELYELEVDRLFRPNWINIGRGDQVAHRNSYASLDLVGEPLLLTRDADGDLHVFSRLCPHRGMEVAEGSGQARTLVCPYHVWSFDLAGRCKNAPLMDGNETFDPASTTLRPVRFELWNGFIFVNLDGTAAPLAPQIQPLADMLAEFNLDELATANTVDWGEIEVDWKMMLENSVECYHHLGTHAKSIGAAYPAELAQTLPDTNNFTLTYAIPSDAAEKRGHGGALSDVINGDTNRLITIFPYNRLSVRGVSTGQLEILPVGPGRCRVRSHIYLHRDRIGTREADAFVAASVERSAVVVGEDLDMCRRLQKMASSRSMAVGPLSAFEAPVWQFYRFLGQGLSRHPLAVAA